MSREKQGFNEARASKVRQATIARHVAKVPPATLKKIQDDAAALAVDMYESKHLLGKYKPTQVDFAAQVCTPIFPTGQEMSALFQGIEDRIIDGDHITDNEERTQHWQMAQFHLRAAYRFVTRAMRT